MFRRNCQTSPETNDASKSSPVCFTIFFSHSSFKLIEWYLSSCVDPPEDESSSFACSEVHNSCVFKVVGLDALKVVVLLCSGLVAQGIGEVGQSMFLIRFCWVLQSINECFMMCAPKDPFFVVEI